MSITDKTRKVLWGRSGNRCATCKHELVVAGTWLDDDSVVGDECHIVSPEVNGPRHDSTYPREEIDAIDNLILLCRVHHKQVDDQVETFTTDILRQMKSNHEGWVREKLSATEHVKPVRIRPVKGQVPDTLKRLTTSPEVLNLALHSLASIEDHDEFRSREEADLVGSFFQELRDMRDLWDEMDASSQAEATYCFAQSFREP